MTTTTQMVKQAMINTKPQYLTVDEILDEIQHAFPGTVRTRSTVRPILNTMVNNGQVQRQTRNVKRAPYEYAWKGEG